MPRTDDAKEKILQAAIDVLAEDGLVGFTHRRIEDRAGVSHGSTTYHFGNRDALYDASVERILRIEAELSAKAVGEAMGGLVGGADADAMLGAPFDWSIDWDSPEGTAIMRRIAEETFALFRASRRTMLARYEIYLAAARAPGGRARLTDARHRVYAAQARQAEILGYPDPELYSRLVPALVDGLLLHDLGVPDRVIERRGGDAIVLALAALYTVPPPADPGPAEAPDGPAADAPEGGVHAPASGQG